jgi:hypothetical protein
LTVLDYGAVENIAGAVKEEKFDLKAVLQGLQWRRERSVMKCQKKTKRSRLLYTFILVHLKK